MRQLAGLATAAALSLGLVGCPSGYEFKSVPGAVRVNAKDVISALAREANEGCVEGLRPYVHCKTDPSLCRGDPIAKTRPSDAECAALAPLMTFVHLSDAQLKEDQVAMEGPLGLPLYDRIASGAGRDPIQERYDFAVLLATVLSVNSLAKGAGDPAGTNPYAPCPAPLAPSFVLHTGDAIDAGMFSELHEFVTIMNELSVPLFNAVGNHDNLFFGTFPKQAMEGIDVTLPFVPVGDTDRFLLAHNPGAHLVDASIPFRPATSSRRPAGDCTAHPPSVPPTACHDSAYSGFDLFCPYPRKGASGSEQASVSTGLLPSPSFPRRPGGLCADARGYYGEDFMLPPRVTAGGATIPRKVRLLVVNTAEIQPRTLSEALSAQSHGNMRPEQLLWLERELAGHTDTETAFVVAGHHNLGGFVSTQQGWLRKILVREPRVLAYLTGHTHVNAFHTYPRPPGETPLLEVIAGSTLVYPQLGNLVDLLEDDRADPAGGARPLYLRVRSFRQRVGDRFWGSECSLKYLAASGRNGAYNDRSDGDWRDEDTARNNANGIFRVSSFRPPEKARP